MSEPTTAAGAAADDPGAEARPAPGDQPAEAARLALDKAKQHRALSPAEQVQAAYLVLTALDDAMTSAGAYAQPSWDDPPHRLANLPAIRAALLQAGFLVRQGLSLERAAQETVRGFPMCGHCGKRAGQEAGMLRLMRTPEVGERRGRPSMLEHFCSATCCDSHTPGTLAAEGVPNPPEPLPEGERFERCSCCGDVLDEWHTVYTVEHAGAPASVMAALCQACRPLTAEEQQDEAPA